MAKVKMIADAKQLYDGKVVHSGDRFTVANETDADDLVAAKFARRDPQQYNTRVLTAAGAAQPTPTPAPVGKRTYKPRMMRSGK